MCVSQLEAGGGVGGQVDSSWPKSGVLELSKVVLRYPTQAVGAPAALRGLTIRIESGEKLGVVGQTREGKSTILSVLSVAAGCSREWCGDVGWCRHPLCQSPGVCTVCSLSEFHTYIA